MENFEKSVNEIVEHSGASQCYVSQQLQHLATQGLLNRREDRTKVYYSLRDKRILNILNALDIFTKNKEEQSWI